jgi:hypothetical protein
MMPLFIETYSSLVGFVPQCLGQALETPTSFKDFSCLWHFKSIPDPTGMHYSLARFPLLRHDAHTHQFREYSLPSDFQNKSFGIVMFFDKAPFKWPYLYRLLNKSP